MERLHQTITNALQTSLNFQLSSTCLGAQVMVDTMVQQTAYATHTTIDRTLKPTSGSLVFNTDIIINISFIANLIEISLRQQQLIHQCTIEANRKRILDNYQLNKEMLILTYKLTN